MSIAPGSTIGIIGGGQLGRMLAIAAAQLGYRSHIYAPEASGPAAEVCAVWTQGDYENADALRRFAEACDVVTYEFENLPVAALAQTEGVRAFHPSVEALRIAQDRALEKGFAGRHDIPTARWSAINTLDELRDAVAGIGTPAILKTRRFGYDGKGQVRLQSPDDVEAAWQAIGGQPAVLEGFVRFDVEYSVIVARGRDGESVAWDVVTNVHDDGILALSTVPAEGQVAAQAAEAVAHSRRLADALDYVGVLAVEWFAGAHGPIFNEMAPRVHNSGHWTIEGATTSQFENHIRAICGLPLGSTALTGRRVAMENLIGAQADRWPAILAERDAHLHLYGKSVRPGRKMGHVTRVTL
ncbi:5-(carboxyamino)imidazole ribonucleotide synthase [Sphingomonas abietis]|uniref:N5-carboxyaminoimidazole ribonucleotide synthase n=1 Tax=Sphingomonas abietis TaxID=3012344 RepID=A0ABY7NPI0_9SPHN|nr:5-(carboxyamino)imidazole ribonucleotide synthase [Sphingomonas abietis]WBO22381.1 5-(carboxyamino)imidazole ribonucleotide synthase [Sphingomonas abietis]